MKSSPNISVILLAGGTGSRMKISTPKQFLKIHDKAVVLYSLEFFMSLPEVAEIIVVCAPEYRYIFSSVNNSTIPIHFALPGNRRQDSVYHGFQSSRSAVEFVCIHDAVRPILEKSTMTRILDAAKAFGAAALGVPIRFTIKECDQNGFVKSTPNRDLIWEIQTPQLLKREILKNGFANALMNDLTVTDDVSFAELIGCKVKIVEGSYSNLKITTSEDLLLVKSLLSKTETNEL